MTTLEQEIDEIKTEIKERERIANTKQCRYCNQWFNRKALTIELFGYCSVQCLEIDYASFKHMKRKLDSLV